MPKTQYLEIKINGNDADVNSLQDFPLAISHSLEDESNFQQKKSSEAIDYPFPASQVNSEIFESFHNPEAEQAKANEFMPVTVTAGGNELLKGKLLLKSATSVNGKPAYYNTDIFASNADWLIELAEKSLWDFASPNIHEYTKENVVSSWKHDGNDESQDYVYTPVRYRKQFDENDTHVKLIDMRPSMFKYWILYRAFKSLGYRIDSLFLDSEFFRRQIMPWTFGDFAFIDNTLTQRLTFRTTGTPLPEPNPDHEGDRIYFIETSSVSGWYILGQDASYMAPSQFENRWDMSHDIPPLGFDNGVSGAFPNGNYEYDPVLAAMKWTYLPDVGAELGIINAEFKIIVPHRAVVGPGSRCRLQLRVTSISGSHVVDIFDYTTVGDHLDDTGNATFKYITIPSVEPGETVTFQLWGYNLGSINVRYAARVRLFVGSLIISSSFLHTHRFSKASGSIVDLSQYESLKTHSFLDFLRGIVDDFNLSIKTDTVNKVVRIEPTFKYYTSDSPLLTSSGYFSESKKDWTLKMDLDQPDTNELFSDFDRIMYFRKKADGNNGGRKRFEEANSIEAGASKFVFNKRFKSGESEMQNRFFGEMMHVQMTPWRDTHDPTSVIIPQIPAFIPENIANTSNTTSESLFVPCSAYYKGQGEGWNSKIKFEGSIYDCPLAFAVNYNDATGLDPVLTYSDQKINGGLVHGLFRRFYLQRMAMMQSGKRKSASFYLENGDFNNPFLNDIITIGSSDYFLFSVNQYMPLLSQSTNCYLWKVDYPKAGIDSNIYPSENSILNNEKANGDDTKYAELLILQSELTND